LRLDVSKLPFTRERFANLSRQGQLFALVADGENAKVVTTVGEEVIDRGEVRGKIEAILQAHDDVIEAKEVKKFQRRLENAVRYVRDGEAVPTDFVVVGTKPGQPEVRVAVRPFLPLD
jgi:hypothetical protein